MKKTYIFDFDGTLADSRTNIVNSFLYATHSCSFPSVKSEDVIPLIGKMNISETFRHFFKHLSTDDSARLVSAFRQYQAEHASKEIKLFPGVITALKAMLSVDNRLVVLSTKNHLQLIKILSDLGLGDSFHFVMGENMTENSPKKPNKQCLSVIAHETDSLARDCIMVGDTQIDAQFAENARIPFVGVSYGIDPPTLLLASGASRIIDSIQELTYG